MQLLRVGKTENMHKMTLSDRPDLASTAFILQAWNIVKLHVHSPADSEPHRCETTVSSHSLNSEPKIENVHKLSGHFLCACMVFYFI